MSPSKNSQLFLDLPPAHFPFICRLGVVSSHGLTGTILTFASNSFVILSIRNVIKNLNFSFLFMTFTEFSVHDPRGVAVLALHGEPGGLRIPHFG